LAFPFGYSVKCRHDQYKPSIFAFASLFEQKQKAMSLIQIGIESNK